MSEKLKIIKEIENSFKDLLDVTNHISADLGESETIEALEAIVDALKKREEIIHAINTAEALLKETTQDRNEMEEYDKHVWLCREIVKQIQQIDQVNMASLNATLNKFMNNVRTTKQSIRAIKAYGSQNDRP